MPIYEYQCKACGHEMEAFQRLSDDPLKECPACGDLELTKLVSAAGFRLKGGGWYETDFKGKQDKKRNLALRFPRQRPCLRSHGARRPVSSGS